MNHFLKLISLIFLITLTTGCDMITKVRNKVRGALFGVHIEDQNSSDGGAEGAPGTPLSAEDLMYKNADKAEITKNQQKLAEITPKTKLLNICEAYAQSLDLVFKEQLLMEIPQRASLFGQALDEEVVSCIYKLAPHFQSKNTDAMDIVLEWYLFLKGKNKEEVGKLLATAMDHEPVHYFKHLAGKLDGKFCPMGVLIPSNVDLDNREQFLKDRRETLLKAKEKLMGKALEELYLQVCIRKIDGDLGLPGQDSLDLTSPAEEVPTAAGPSPASPTPSSP